MELYILTNNWTTPDNDGVEVQGVYSSFEKAHESMLTEVKQLCAEFPDDQWDEDLCCDEPDYVSRGFFGADAFGLNTIYHWNIAARYLDDEQPEK